MSVGLTRFAVVAEAAYRTSNMKFMMNGTLTIGTRDGATIEMEVRS